jgi:hypothetical protein
MLRIARNDMGAVARNARVFREARRRLSLEITAITHRNAAKGLLKSGATIKEIVRAFDETTIVGVREALNGIAAVSQHAGRKRKRLLAQLQASLADQHAVAVKITRQAIERIGLGNDFKHAVPLIEQAKQRHRETVADFGEGWTAPAGKPWKERHPILYDALLLLIGAAVGIAGQALTGSVFASPEAANSSLSRVVAPIVAPAPTPAQAPAQNHA